MTPAVQANTPGPGPKCGTPMASTSVARSGQESTEKEKTANCSGCGQRFPMRLLLEVHDEHISYGYGVRIGERYCKPCARATRVFS
jgi:hypothetical protein